MTLAARLVRNNFAAVNGVLAVGGVPVSELAAQFGTPLYIYDAAIIERQYRSVCRATAGFAEVFYSIKANPHPGIVRLLLEWGAGLEIASGGEFLVAAGAGCPAGRIVFAGPGKGAKELALTLERGLGELHLESFEEIETCATIAGKLGRRVRVAIRVNPSAEAQGGAMRMGGKPAAFGFDEETLDDVIAAIARHDALDLTGIHMFAGTQILDAAVLLDQWRYGLTVASRVAKAIGRPLRSIDLGGGLGIPYHANDRELDLDTVAAAGPSLRALLQEDELLRDARVIVEPGRFLVGPAGVYLAAVRSVKHSRGTRFVVTDGGMHHHLAASGNLGQVIKRDYPIIAANRIGSPAADVAMVTGPLCTPLDTIGRQTALPDLNPGDLIAILQSGAYGLTASPTGFLSHPPPTEILIRNGERCVLPATAEQT